MKAVGPGNDNGWGANHGWRLAGRRRSDAIVAARDLRDHQSLQHHPEEVAQFREALNLLGALPMAALLREIGITLFNRGIARWQILTDISDELLDAAMLEARARLTTKWLEKPARAPRPRATPRMKARQAERAKDRGEITRGDVSGGLHVEPPEGEARR
jgi:hypothetical protein